MAAGRHSPTASNWSRVISTSVQNRVTADAILFHTVLEALQIASAIVASAALSVLELSQLLPAYLLRLGASAICTQTLDSSAELRIAADKSHTSFPEPDDFGN